MNYELPNGRPDDWAEKFLQQIKASNKCLSNVANSNLQLRRHLLASDDHLSGDIKEVGKKQDAFADQLDDNSDQIAEGHELILKLVDEVGNLRIELNTVKNQQSYLLAQNGIDPHELEEEED